MMSIIKRSSLSSDTPFPPRDVASKAHGIAKQGKERGQFVECPAEYDQAEM